ncbi:MAG TPA: hypothetical protein VGT61_09850 [Thermomicrobiales bacterium]|jgi:hypothetical protein|nr:hypothetical protein [Thermomicrobiales bacterium]
MLWSSSFAREDRGSAGSNPSTSTSNTIALIVYRDAYGIGDRQQVQRGAERIDTLEEQLTAGVLPA